MARILLHAFVSLALVISTLPSAAFARVALSEQAPASAVASVSSNTAPDRMTAFEMAAEAADQTSGNTHCLVQSLKRNLEQNLDQSAAPTDRLTSAAPIDHADASLSADDCCLSDCSCAATSCTQAMCDAHLTATSIISGKLIAHAQDERIDGVALGSLGHPPRA